ncbi:methylenetetrahydrofolate reductase 2-like [Drosophila serrata]|uniref:methylenetetrahydrofolate reductase 2-like n=1 Tax=Drosophila serrata TaxID=7274 RepID=UPI000A1D007F|nr:methylenetetrahydrofolate reductase 2-like [Drosophila serrata]
MAHCTPGVRSSSPPLYVPCVTFAPEQNGLVEQRIGPLIAEHHAQRRLFYGMEILPRSRGKPVCLDFNRFLPILPMFVSMTWLGTNYWDVEPIDQVDSLQLARHLAPRIPVMPHLTAYRLTDERLDQFLDLSFKNMLALRGDLMFSGQRFPHSKSIVERAKNRSGDKISICVGGFPEGYNITEGQAPDLTKHIQFLKEKVSAGVDCIITQVCYRPEVIIQFVKEVRAAGITAPIMIGIMTHQTFHKYTFIEKITSAKLPSLLRQELVQLQTEPEADEHLTRTFFVHHNVHIIKSILEADLNIYGFQFFTLNHFEAVEALLKELHLQNLFSDKEKELQNSNKVLFEK